MECSKIKSKNEQTNIKFGIKKTSYSFKKTIYRYSNILKSTKWSRLWHNIIKSINKLTIKPIIKKIVNNKIENVIKQKDKFNKKKFKSRSK